MEIFWKNNATDTSAILYNREFHADNFYVKKTQVLAGEMPEFVYPFHELHLMTHGNIVTKRQTSSGNTQVDCANSERMCIVPAGQTVCAEWQDHFEMLIVGFDPKYLARMACEFHISSDIELVEKILQKDGLVEHLCMAFLAEPQKEEQQSKLYTDSLIRTLMFHLINNYTNTDKSIRKSSGGLSAYKIRRINDFIQDNLEKDFTVFDMSEIVNLSYFHFVRVFKQALSMTPQQYVMQCRLEKAKQLLSASDLPIIEICFQTGFKTQSHFTTLFHKFTGQTPKTWREENNTVYLSMNSIFRT